LACDSSTGGDCKETAKLVENERVHGWWLTSDA